jgi:hypothetical protein
MRRWSGLILIAAVVGSGMGLAIPAAASTTEPFHAEFKETFGRAASKPCDHFLCGTGTVEGYGKATSAFDLNDFQPIEGSTCGAFTAVRVITLVADDSTLTLDETGQVCFPGNSSLAPGTEVSNGLPALIDGLFVISDGTGVFAGATGAGTDHDRNAGDQGHATLDGTITIP